VFIVGEPNLLGGWNPLNPLHRVGACRGDPGTGLAGLASATGAVASTSPSRAPVAASSACISISRAV
jgi:hypothetical protein